MNTTPTCKRGMCLWRETMLFSDTAAQYVHIRLHVMQPIREPTAEEGFCMKEGSGRVKIPHRQAYWSQAMFHLSCVRVHTGHETGTHKKLGVHIKFSIQKWFLHNKRHSTLRWIQVNVAQKKFYARTNFTKLEGTLITGSIVGPLSTHTTDRAFRS